MEDGAEDGVHADEGVEVVAVRGEERGVRDGRLPEEEVVGEPVHREDAWRGGKREDHGVSAARRRRTSPQEAS